METNGVGDSEQAANSLLVFDWIEYAIFFSMISLSALIGVYFGFKLRKREVTVDDYMLGGRKMPIIPVALSLMASFVSGVTLVGIPAETYLYGTQMAGVLFAICIAFVLLNIFYLPVLYNLQFKSLFEYLERRFNRTVRQYASIVFTISILMHTPVVIYVPVIAFNQVTGMPLYHLAPIVCTICIFYTSIGGLKAVVWSDALQSLFTFGSMIFILILGIMNVGGLSKLIEINEVGERLELFNMDPDLFQRNTFWTTVVGSIPNWLKILTSHPSTVQRYISLPTYRQAQIATFIMCLSIVLIKGISTVIGLIIYAEYQYCDPIVTQKVKKSAQILPLYVMHAARNVSGLAGLFLSGVVSTGLSTMSTGLNTVAGTIYEDFLRPILPWEQTDSSANFTMKILVVLLGVITTLLLFVVDQLGTILQVSLSLLGVTTGVQLYLFTLGMFVPWANAKGAMAGIFAGLGTTAWMMIGAQIYEGTGDIFFGTKMRSIDGCPRNLTKSLGLNQTRFGFPGEGTVVIFSDDVNPFYRVSFILYSSVGFLSAMLTACVTSLLTGLQDSDVDPQLIIPQLRKYLTTTKTDEEPVTLYKIVPTKDPDQSVV